MMLFQPDLIVEVTSVCNRACVGCYAPNLVSNKNKHDLYEEQPHLYLNPDKFKDMILSWDNEIPDLVTFRGGEPSVHPKIRSILTISSLLSKNLILETHARWILDQNIETDDLLEVIKNLNVTVKISFDKMHGLDTKKLEMITSKLEMMSISYLIAITEESYEVFEETRRLCSNIHQSKIIFQRKISNFQELIKPRVGVINIKSELNANLSSKV